MITFKHKILCIEDGKAQIKEIESRTDKYEQLALLALRIEDFIGIEELKEITKFGDEKIEFREPHRFIPSISNFPIGNLRINKDLNGENAMLITKEEYSKEGVKVSIANSKDFTNEQWKYLYSKFKEAIILEYTNYEIKHRNKIIKEQIEEERKVYLVGSREYFHTSTSKSTLFLDIPQYQGFHIHIFYSKNGVTVQRISNLGYGSWSWDDLRITIDSETRMSSYNHQNAIEELNRLIDAEPDQLLEYKKEIIKNNIRNAKQMLTHAEEYLCVFKENKEFLPEERAVVFTHLSLAQLHFSSSPHFLMVDYSNMPIEALTDFITKMKQIVNELIDRHANCKLDTPEAGLLDKV